MKTEEQKFIEEKADWINTLGITDSISEDSLRDICLEYSLKFFGHQKKKSTIIKS
jgi:hypothetical protein